MFKNTWFTFVLVVLLAGLVKGGLHIVRIVILAGLGLAGMWMLHTLAQDYDKISNRFMASSGNGAPAGGMKAFIAKRSPDSGNNNFDIPGFPQLKWETILSQDPEGCVPNFICQLAAIPDVHLQQNERNVLKLLRATSEKNTKANKIVRQALKIGEKHSSNYCHKYYPHCPYNKETIIALIQTYGGT